MCVHSLYAMLCSYIILYLYTSGLLAVYYLFVGTCGVGPADIFTTN